MPGDIRTSFKWLKTDVLATVLTEEERNKVVPKAVRKAWVNWARRHPDAEVRGAAAEVMCHSDDVAQTNYVTRGIENAGMVGQAVISDVVGTAAPAEVDHRQVEVESDSDDDDDTPVKKGPYTTKQKLIFHRNLFIDGKPPPTVNNVMIDRACEKDAKFNNLYKALERQFGSRRDANKSIKKCICPKKK